MVPMQSVLFSARDEEGFRVARLRQKQIIGLGGGEVSSELGSGAFLLVVFATLASGWVAARPDSGPQGPVLRLTMSKCSCTYCVLASQC